MLLLSHRFRSKISLLHCWTRLRLCYECVLIKVFPFPISSSLHFHSFHYHPPCFVLHCRHNNDKETSKFHETWRSFRSLAFQIQIFSSTLHIPCPICNFTSLSLSLCVCNNTIQLCRLTIFNFYWKSQVAILLILYACIGSGNKLF